MRDNEPESGTWEIWSCYTYDFSLCTFSLMILRSVSLWFWGLINVVKIIPVSMLRFFSVLSADICVQTA